MAALSADREPAAFVNSFSSAEREKAEDRSRKKPSSGSAVVDSLAARNLSSILKDNQSHIVALRRARSKSGDLVDDSLVQLGGWRAGALANERHQRLFPELFSCGIFGFGYAVAVNDELVAGKQLGLL